MDDDKLFSQVLLIEDDPAHATVIRRVLREFVENTSHCNSSAAALTHLAIHRPDLIITDLNLGDNSKDGNLKKLKEAAGDIPIVVLTSSTSLVDAVDAMKEGARDFIVKNFDSNFRELFGLSLSRVRAAIALEAERAQLMRSLEVLRVAIENSADALAVTDREGVVRYCNSAFRSFAKQCGGNPRNAGELFTKTVNQSDRLQEALSTKLQTLAPGAVWNTEVTFAENKVLAFDASLSVIHSPSASDLADECVLWVRNISEQKRRERFQREILSTTTHDLKGPLGAIAISADLLSDMVKGTKKVEELVWRVSSSAQSAINLIDEFLSARRIQEGSLILKPSKQEVNELLGEVVESFQAVARAKQINMECHLESPTVTWQYDKLGMQRVLGNLLSNACKFTPKGGTIHVKARVLDHDLKISVEDSGCGMEPAEVLKIFERFARLDKHSDVAGSGLGLFVVKSVVAAHGGRIDVTSQPGKGSLFEISLPASPPVNERGELLSLDFA